VLVDELVRAVSIALEVLPASACSAADANRDERVSIEELIGAVERALSGCVEIPPRL
jgi:hypothetical protein